MTKLERFAAIATIIAVVIAAIALIPGFGQWLSPREPNTISKPSNSEQNSAESTYKNGEEVPIAVESSNLQPDQNLSPTDFVTSDYGELLYEENFDKDDETWSLREGSIIKNGELIIQSGTDSAPYSDVPYSDFIFETPFRHIDPQGNSETDIYLRSQVPPCAEWNCSIQIWISGDWRTLGVRRIKGTETTRILSDIFAPQLDPTAWNKLTVRVEGNNYEIFVDGAFVQSFTDSAYSSGKFAFSSAPGVTAFDYVRIYALP